MLVPCVLAQLNLNLDPNLGDASKGGLSLVGPTLYQPRGKERVWSNPIHDLVVHSQQSSEGRARLTLLYIMNFRKNLRSGFLSTTSIFSQVC